MNAKAAANLQPQFVTVPLRDAFGHGNAETISALDMPPAIGAVRSNPNYVFRKELVRNLYLFWVLPNHRACMLVGPAGSGKTTAVEQWHSRLNWPLLMVNGHDKMSQEDLFGQFLPNSQGGLDWQDGPLTQAARVGCSVLINEFNAVPSGVTIALNDIAQAGSRITIPQTGEIVEAAPGFRIFATMNPPGQGTVRYHGRKPIDSSTRERFMWIKVPYASKEDEIKVVVNAFASCGAVNEAFVQIATRMVDLANQVRAQSVDNAAGADAIVETLSTRILERWAIHWAALSRLPGAGHLALRNAFTNGCDPDAAAAIHEMVALQMQVPFPSDAP